jgi:hypothetical protein
MKRNIIITGLFFMLILVTFASAEVDHYYKIDLEYSFGEITYQNIEVVPSTKELKVVEGKYVAELVSFDNEILDITFFAFPLTILWDSWDEETGEINGGGITNLNETETTIYIPYSENALEIDIYDWDLNKKLIIPVTEFSEETFIEKFEQKEIEKEFFGEKLNITTKEREKSEQSYLWLWILLGVIGLLLIIIILVINKKRSSNIQ